MRGLTSTLVLLVILAGLGAFIYYDKDNNPGAEPPKARRMPSPNATCSTRRAQRRPWYARQERRASTTLTCRSPRSSPK